MNERGLRDLCTELLGAAVRFDEPLSRHTSFRIGGPAEVWIEASDTDDVRRAQDAARATDRPLLLLGGGSNVLVSDEGVRGIVLKLGRAFASVEWTPNGRATYVRAGAAGSFKRLVAESVRQRFEGLEFGEGIPGTVGGGLLMNAGAFGGEIASVVTTIEGVSRDGQVAQLSREALHFGYRHFDLPPGFIVTHVNFRLPHAADPSTLNARVAAAKRRRGSGQPLGFPNAGSIFKNPPGEFAGRLIERVGLKGCRRGNAMFSEQHANFIVNLGGASAADVRGLMDEAVARVSSQCGILLEPEVKLVGEWT